MAATSPGRLIVHDPASARRDGLRIEPRLIILGPNPEATTKARRAELTGLDRAKDRVIRQTSALGNVAGREQPVAHAALASCARLPVCEHAFVPEFSFTVTERDPDRPWIVIGQERRTVELADGAAFFDWAHRTWPEPRYGVQLDPHQLMR